MKTVAKLQPSLLHYVLPIVTVDADNARFPERMRLPDLLAYKDG